VHVDLAPNIEPMMHRSQSWDYGIVIEGEVGLVLEEGVTRVLRRVDMVVRMDTKSWVEECECDGVGADVLRVAGL